MLHAVSPDGTRLTAYRTGHGPALLLVHGTTADHTRWGPVMAGLERHFTVYAMDRRGRGESGDAAEYAMEREFEDVAAVVDAIGGPVLLLGHSYGAICSLEATLRTRNVAKLVLYEPPVPTGTPIYPPGMEERLRERLDAGDREGLLVIWFRDVVQVPPAELDILRSARSWPGRIAAAHTVPREMHAAERYALPAGRVGSVTVPTLILEGGDSPPFFHAAVDVVHRAVPGSRIELLPGQQHTAMNTAPELFLEKVLAFLL